MFDMKHGSDQPSCGQFRLRDLGIVGVKREDELIMGRIGCRVEN